MAYEVDTNLRGKIHPRKPGHTPTNAGLKVGLADLNFWGHKETDYCDELKSANLTTKLRGQEFILLSSLCFLSALQ